MAQSTKHFTHAGAHVLTEADGADAAAPPPSEPEGFPLHAMRMKDFLALEKLRPHNALKKEGLVVALDFDGAHKDAKLNFVSHQWLAYAEADPNGDHLKTMLETAQISIGGHQIIDHLRIGVASFCQGTESLACSAETQFGLLAAPNQLLGLRVELDLTDSPAADLDIVPRDRYFMVPFMGVDLAFNRMNILYRSKIEIFAPDERH